MHTSSHNKLRSERTSQPISFQQRAGLRFPDKIREVTLLDRRHQRLSGAGVVSDIVPGALAECIGEATRLSIIAPEQHDACIKVL
jgi:hypothetical protein